ncbi:MAG TPA: aspartate/glutamate racemase family protein, partial [Methylomirabilota bacterium]
DTGLDAARVLARAPVVGIGEAAFHAASLVAGRFSVVTTLGRSVPAIEHNLTRYGLATRCARVRAAEVPVLALEDPGGDARARIEAEIDAAKREDRAEAIVLGCAGMADLAATLSVRHGLPVVDGVAAAVVLVEALVRLGLRTSKQGGYAPPRAKAVTGFPDLA